MYYALIEAPYPERKDPPSKWYSHPHCVVIAVESKMPEVPLKPKAERPNPLTSLSLKLVEVRPFFIKYPGSEKQKAIW